jgi:hypothetical protein
LLEQVAGGVEHVDGAQTGAGLLVVAAAFALGVGDVDVLADGLDAERRVARRRSQVSRSLE